MDQETWLPISGYEGRYEVSDIGRVRGLPRTRTLWHGGVQRLPGKILAPGVGRGGYLHVVLHDGNSRWTRPVHLLVLGAFIGPRPAGLHAAHDDGVNTNNCAGNLGWKTRAENEQDKRKHGAYHLSGGRRRGIPKPLKHTGVEVHAH